jgi:8-oxo-dGTP pyrophosphatase MutT (NUDIX family)/glycosyltransferase involved in cell wall biosynthesis
MQFDENDQIEYSPTGIKHESAGGFVFFEDDKTHELFVALLLRKTDGHYLIPKGHIRKGEEAQDAAIREVKEELTLKETPEIVSFLRIDSYTFTLDGSDATHYKNVHLYVFRLNEKVDIKPNFDEGFDAAEWIPFEKAVEKISFDRENLLKARQCFYFNKPVAVYKNLADIKSLTVAIPTHNGELTISKTLKSLFENLREIGDSVRKEVIICVDHCVDNTVSVIENFLKENQLDSAKVSLVENDGAKGKSNALNKIFSVSSGEILCVVDDDVILEEKCLINLIEALITQKNLRCVFSSWKRLPLQSKNPWKLFWHWVLGIKFEVQPYNKPSEIMRGATMMLRRDNFVYLPAVLNEDQFLQYIYWPQTKEVENSVIYFNSVASISDYYRRFIRIMVGSKQLSKHFAKDRIEKCSRALFQKLDYRKILRLPWKLKGPFLLYRFIRLFINSYVKIKVWFIDDYEWFRFRQN